MSTADYQTAVDVVQALAIAALALCFILIAKGWADRG